MSNRRTLRLQPSQRLSMASLRAMAAACEALRYAWYHGASSPAALTGFSPAVSGRGCAS
jgi:hypothetical protein